MRIIVRWILDIIICPLCLSNIKATVLIKCIKFYNNLMIRVLYLENVLYLLFNLKRKTCSHNTTCGSTTAKLYWKHLQSAIQINFITREGNKACVRETPSFPELWHTCSFPTNCNRFELASASPFSSPGLLLFIINSSFGATSAWTATGRVST